MKSLTPEEKLARVEKRKAEKDELEKIKRFKRRMEIVRTVCAVLMLLMNSLILMHIFGIL